MEASVEPRASEEEHGVIKMSTNTNDWGFNERTRRNRERRAYDALNAPAMVQVRLSDREALPEGIARPHFLTASGWVSDRAGLDVVVNAMIAKDELSPVHTLIRTSGSMPNRLADGASPFAEVGRPISGLPELMGEVLTMDAAMPASKHGTALLACVSSDDHETLVAGLYGDRLDEDAQRRFDEAVAAAYLCATSDDDDERTRRASMLTPEVLVVDAEARPVWIRLTPSVSIVIASTGIAGGGKDTSAIAARSVTGPRSTTSNLTSLGWAVVEKVRAAHDGVEVGMVASHGGTSKDALVAHTAGLNASTAPVSGGQTYLLSTPFSEFADSERADVGLELMSTLGLTAFSMRPTPPKGGWHVTVVEDEHHSRRSLLLSMAEHALTHHARLQPVGLDRTDVRARIMGWSRDLGMGSDFTRLEAKNGEGMLPQQTDLWTLAGDVVSLERLRHALNEPVVDEAITVQLQQLVSRSLSTMSGSMSAAFRADRVSHARRCFKATLVRLHLPEGHGFTKEQLTALRVVMTNAASAAFLDETSNVAAPKVLVTVTTLPSVLLNEPQLTVVNLTHAVDLIRAVLEDTQLELAEMTPHGLRSVRESKFKASQLSRSRIDAMIAALDGQAQTRVIEGWKVYWRLMRSRIFTGGYGGGRPSVDAGAFDH
jgi:hypothetical protein